MEVVNDIPQLKGVSLSKLHSLIERLKFDDNTYRHSMSVAKYSNRFNKIIAANINSETIYYSGLLHDIGKTEVNINILNKKGSLDIDEFSIMMEHSKLGYNLLKKHLMPIEMQHAALYHHERWDGNGYPMKLEKQRIPLVARIISICDVYDALTSNRPYRKAFSIDEALDIMKNSHGQFDNELLDIFSKNIDSII
ncbi:HD-GYP domain-containing protein [Lutispora thermophila]|uniref:HDIG domain-containing protein n=1 Tax=Lutispora thermophila DSM 19022 TaxID=1122184 RepID=A0A1M6HCQ8_9FIRM|nr:HD domain-containing phosphohydrolase [Lutispora thermophila]SHJ19941.1 HDIG domain-containing protein [Lutispora thermophila DSM 19022]